MTTRLRAQTQGRHHRPRTWRATVGDWLTVLGTPAWLRRLVVLNAIVLLLNLAGLVLHLT